MAQNIKPFRDVSEHDVLNLFTYSGASLPVTKGTFVRISSGWSSTVDPNSIAGSPGFTYGNSLSPRWSVPATVTSVSTWDEVPLGITLYDIREVDENGELLVFRPQKKDEMQCVLSGEAVPIVTKGMFLYSGVNGGAATGGSLAYSGPLNGLYTTGVNSVGKFLGPVDSNGCVLLKLDL